MKKFKFKKLHFKLPKFHFGVIVFRKHIVNLCVAGIFLVLTIAAVVGSSLGVPTAAVSGVYYNGDTSSKYVSLMINVYWGTEYMDDMLATLKEKNVKTTFFIGGTWAVMEEDMLKKIKAEGHELANHGYYHKDHNKLSEEDNYNEIATTHKLVKGLTGEEMTLFAPPSGAYNKVTVSVASSLGYKTIMWTRDTIDWRDKDTDLIYKRAIKNAKGGDLILMHPTKHTAEALPKIIDYYQSNGFELVPVSTNIGQVTA